MGLTCQLGFHCLIYASKEYLDKGFKLQFTSKLHIAQSLGVGECPAPYVDVLRKQTLPWVRHPGWTWQRCLGMSLSLVSLPSCFRESHARTQSFCVVLPASYPERLPIGITVNKFGISVNILGISMSVMPVSKQALCISRSQNTFEEGGWSPLSQEMIRHHLSLMTPFHP